MSALGDKRREFSWKMSILELVAKAMGYEIARGRGFASENANKADGGRKRSVHLAGLGQDLNLYINGRYIRDDEGHDKLHDVWDMMGGAERIDEDMNHYSFEWQGMR